MGMERSGLIVNNLSMLIAVRVKTEQTADTFCM